jgi:hypothetical protein
MPRPMDINISDATIAVVGLERMGFVAGQCGKGYIPTYKNQ